METNQRCVLSKFTLYSVICKLRFGYLQQREINWKKIYQLDKTGFSRVFKTCILNDIFSMIALYLCLKASCWEWLKGFCLELSRKLFSIPPGAKSTCLQQLTHGEGSELLNC